MANLLILDLLLQACEVELHRAGLLVGGERVGLDLQLHAAAARHLRVQKVLCLARASTTAAAAASPALRH